MSETTSTPTPTPTPTPTEPHHDAVALAQRLDVLSYDLMVGGQDNAYRSTLALSGIPDMRRAANLLRDLAAVSAAATDERELVGHLDRFIADCAAEGVEKGVLSVEWAGRLRAALAARPAPTVNAADVRAGVLAACWPNGDALDGISARTANLITASVMRHLGLTVADEGRA